ARSSSRWSAHASRFMARNPVHTVPINPKVVTTVNRTTVSFCRRIASTSRKFPMSCSSSRMSRRHTRLASASEMADGSHQPSGEHVGNEKEQEMLMTKTGKEAAIRVHKKAIVCFSDDDEGMSGAHEARACELFAETGIAIAVVAEALLELAE